MKALPTVLLLPLLACLPLDQKKTSDIEGVYDMVWFDGTSYIPVGPPSGSMEFRADSTWVLSVSYEDLGAPVRSWGGYSVTGEKDGCTVYESWPEDSRDNGESNIICNGVLSLRHVWYAVFKKRD